MPTNNETAPAPKAQKKRGVKPNPLGHRPNMIAVSCRQPYKDWVEALARTNRRNMSQFIDDALVAYAAARGAPPPPERG